MAFERRWSLALCGLLVIVGPASAQWLNYPTPGCLGIPMGSRTLLLPRRAPPMANPNFPVSGP
jgi:hypothetical protein